MVHITYIYTRVSRVPVSRNLIALHSRFTLRAFPKTSAETRAREISVYQSNFVGALSTISPTSIHLSLPTAHPSAWKRKFRKALEFSSLSYTRPSNFVNSCTRGEVKLHVHATATRLDATRWRNCFNLVSLVESDRMRASKKVTRLARKKSVDERDRGAAIADLRRIKPRTTESAQYAVY